MTPMPVMTMRRRSLWLTSHILAYPACARPTHCIYCWACCWASIIGLHTPHKPVAPRQPRAPRAGTP